MAYIHETPDWPHFRWNADAFEAALADVHVARGRLHGRLDALGLRGATDDHGAANVEADAIASAAIEGERLDPAEVRSSVARRLGLDTAGLPAPSRTVDGFVATLIDATRHANAPLDTERLHRWHHDLFPEGTHTIDAAHIGRWRPEAGDPMRVVSGPIGRERVHFVAPSASRIASEMHAFLAWFEGGAPPRDAVVRSGVAHLWFLTIHPYEDGNGRLARAIADLTIARGDARTDRAFSLSAQVAADRRAYYLALERQQSASLDITPWLSWWVACVGRAVAAAMTSLNNTVARAAAWAHLDRLGLNDRQRRVISRVLDGFQGNLTTAKYAAMARCSTDTALRDLQGLVAAGVVTPTGGRGRAAAYRITEPN